MTFNGLHAAASGSVTASHVHGEEEEGTTLTKRISLLLFLEPEKQKTQIKTAELPSFFLFDSFSKTLAFF